MKLCCEQLGMRRRKKTNLGKIGKRRRLKRGRNSISCLNPTQAMYMPLDLQINILLRLPVSSLLRFRCVSKRWSSIIASRDFRNRYLNTNTSAPPRILVSLGDFYGDELMVFSSEGEEKDVSVPYKDVLRIEGGMVCGAVRGLICFRSGFEKVGICNPSTRQIQILPILKFNRNPDFVWSPNYFIGHDPVEDQYKVLAIDNASFRLEHKVVVLGEGAWKETSVAFCPHTAITSGLCINGFIYYGAHRTDIDYPGPDNPSVMVCFDVRLEKFNIIKVPLPVGRWDLWYSTESTLINYRGKVGVVEHPRCEAHGAFRMWVLEDAEREEWSMVSFLLPKSALGLDFEVMCFVSAAEICMVPRELSDPFCLHFYNLQTNSIRKVRFEGLPVRKLQQAKLQFTTVSVHSQSIMFLDT